MATHAHGPFEVHLKPLTNDTGAPLARMSLDKQYHGDLEGVARGQMLSAATTVEGSAGYVAIERVEGTLQGRRGSFLLQHFGIMTRAVGELKISVIPDSGTDQLAGLTGQMAITIADGKHSYDLAYDLPAG
jgi:hypothetical protein